VEISARGGTYNYSQRESYRSRINLTLYSLSNIINGDIQKIIRLVQLVENTEKLKENSDAF
jgi:peptide chain release factor 1